MSTENHKITRQHDIEMMCDIHEVLFWLRAKAMAHNHALSITTDGKIEICITLNGVYPTEQSDETLLVQHTPCEKEQYH